MIALPWFIWCMMLWGSIYRVVVGHSASTITLNASLVRSFLYYSFLVQYEMYIITQIMQILLMTEHSSMSKSYTIPTHYRAFVTIQVMFSSFRAFITIPMETWYHKSIWEHYHWQKHHGKDTSEINCSTHCLLYQALSLFLDVPLC